MKKVKNIIICVAIIFIIVLLQYIPNILSYIRIIISQNQINKCELFPQKNTVNIVAITDANFITPLNVTIYSAIKNKNKSSKYHFYILGINLNKDNIEELKKQSTKETPVTVVKNDNIYDFYVLQTHVPNVDFFKFNIPDIFPYFDKMLYLDGDLIVQKDLSNLYNMDIEDSYAAASFDKSYKEEEILGIKRYFNNGVMLLNLKKMREDKIADKMLRYRIFKSPNRYATQDTFNVILQSNIKEFDSTYNVCTNFLDKDSNADFLKTSAIIHYAGFPKPWDDKNILYASTWEKYHDEYKRKYYKLP